MPFIKRQNKAAPNMRRTGNPAVESAEGLLKIPRDGYATRKLLAQFFTKCFNSPAINENFVFKSD
jgi:hypothetical protein